MKVVLLGPFPPPHGGVQTNLVAIRDHLRSHHHAVSVINLTRFRRRDADGVFYPRSAVQTARMLLQQSADIIHMHFGGNLGRRLLGLSLFCSLLPRAKTVITFHSGGYGSSPEGQAVTRNSLTGMVLRRLDALIAVNQEIGEFFLRCGVAANRIHVISPHSLAQTADQLPEPMQTFFAAHDPVLVSVGGLEPEYCVPLQLEALERLRTQHPDAGLIVIGGGSLQEQVRKQWESMPDREHILLAGDVPHATTLRAISESRVVLRTTQYDGDSISVREAIDLGVPVIATDNGMRPPGCHLIPGPHLEPLVNCVEQVLLAGSPAVKAPSQGFQNLEAVLELYRNLLGPRTDKR